MSCLQSTPRGRIFGASRKARPCARVLLNAPDDPPIFETAEVTEVESFDRDAKPPGLIFYPEDSDEDTEPKHDA